MMIICKFWVHLSGKMGVDVALVPRRLGPQNRTNMLAHWADLLSKLVRYNKILLFTITELTPSHLAKQFAHGVLRTQKNYLPYSLSHFGEILKFKKFPNSGSLYLSDGNLFTIIGLNMAESTPIVFLCAPHSMGERDDRNLYILTVRWVYMKQEVDLGVSLRRIFSSTRDMTLPSNEMTKIHNIMENSTQFIIILKQNISRIYDIQRI